MGRKPTRPTSYRSTGGTRLYVGPTGCGKSRASRQWLPEAWIWNPANGGWFDGYLRHHEVIFEEFRGDILYSAKLSILNRYTHSHQVKGGMIDFIAQRIAITSPKMPELWYPRQCEKTDSINQLLRRITSITVFEGPLTEAETKEPAQHEIIKIIQKRKRNVLELMA